MTNTVYILHGRDSSPRSQKCEMLSAACRHRGWKAVVPDYSGISSADDRAKLFIEEHVDDERPGKVLIVGSSMGAYVALAASRKLKPDALLLLAPAVYLPGYALHDPMPHAARSVIIHGWCDDTVPPSYVVRFADRYKCELHLLDDRHDLSGSLPFIKTLFNDMLDQLQPVSRLRRLTPTL